jgi:hypothetical protein
VSRGWFGSFGIRNRNYGMDLVLVQERVLFLNRPSFCFGTGMAAASKKDVPFGVVGDVGFGKGVESVHKTLTQ